MENEFAKNKSGVKEKKGNRLASLLWNQYM